MGQILRADLKLSDYLSALNKRINWIIFKLTGLRRRGNLKLNINLWTMFCIPSIRLAFLNLNFTNSTDKKKFYLSIKILFKRFVGLPKNCPNKIVYELMPNIEMKS